ncbi:MAG: prepilin peptidase [Bacteroidia bacterium]
MSWIVDALCFVFLSVIIYQDFKYRQIAWVLLAALFVLFFVKSSFNKNPAEVFINILFSMAFIAIQLMLLTFYFSLRQKKIFNIVNTYLGLGDILFLIVLTALFAPVNYILFFITGMFITLAGYGIYIFIKKDMNYKIPLAGCLGMQLVICFILQYPMALNFNNDDTIKNVLQQWMI